MLNTGAAQLGNAVGGAVEFRLLGPVELRLGERVVATGRPQQQLLLAALAVDVGRLVPVDTLIDRVWDAPPDGARRTLHVLVSRLRRVLAQPAEATPPARVVRQAGGYLLQADPERVDMVKARRLAARARDPGGGSAQRAVLLHQALQLWRGEPLSGLTGQWVERTRLALCQEHLDLVVGWARAQLQAGDPAELLGPLTDLAGEHPLTESLTEVLMLALCATGRPADALSVYAETRRRLADELGTDPCPALRGLHQQILRGQLPAPASTPHRTRAAPRQLPAAVAHFAGRSAELSTLTGLLDTHGATGAAVVISAIGGTAGVGKTALAVHWAHQVCARFPDGQLYVNLRGFDPSGPALEPAAVIAEFLHALGVAVPQLPANQDALAALYRSELAGRRMLIVLDNARDSTQVRPLLPGTPGSLVLVTSRNILSGLIAAAGAHPVNLDVVSAAEARQLLACRLGAARVLAEPDAVEEIISRCARLPLALSIVAARAATHPQLALHALAAALRGTTGGLAGLSTDETDLPAVFSWSYRTLTPGAAQLFRHLGLHPGPELSEAAAISLTALPAQSLRPLLTELTSSNLLMEHAPGRYTFHDLLRAYAAGLATEHDTGQQRRAATHRLLDHYLHSGHSAARQLDPTADPIALTPPQPGVVPEVVTDHQQALAWFSTEHTALVAAVGHAADSGFGPHTWQLAWTMYDFLHRRGHWHDWAMIGQAALTAARRLADPLAQARTHRHFAAAYLRLGRLDDAHAQLLRSLDLTIRANDLAGQAHTYRYLGHLLGRQGHHAQALAHARQALDLYRAAEHRRGQADALNAIGWLHAQLGDHQQALVACRQALRLQQELGDREGQAATWDSLGYAHHHAGQHTQAIVSYQHALDLLRDLGDRYAQAITRTHLGDTHHAIGDHDAARAAWLLALTTLTELHHPEAEQVRAKLTALRTDPAGVCSPAHGLVPDIP